MLQISFPKFKQPYINRLINIFIKSNLLRYKLIKQKNEKSTKVFYSTKLGIEATNNSLT
jgi:hypothetical protein